MQTDAQGKLGQSNYGDLDDKKIRRAIIFLKQCDSRVEKLKSALEKFGFQVHLIDLQHLLLTLEKSTNAHSILQSQQSNFF